MAAKPRKWEHLRERFKRLPLDLKFADDVSFREKVDAIKAALLDKTKQELAEIYNEAWEADDIVKAEQKEINAYFEALELLLVEHMDEASEQAFKLKSGESFVRGDEPYVNVKDKDALRAWFKEQGQEEILNPHHSTLTAIVKGILEQPIDPLTGQAKPLPAGIDIFMKATVKRRGK
jgi:hypothetical protein